jgi:hypothetical protein
VDTTTQTTKPRKPTISATVEPEVVRDLERLRCTIPLCTRHKAHCVALRLGLDILLAEPGRLLAEIKIQGER